MEILRRAVTALPVLLRHWRQLSRCPARGIQTNECVCDGESQFLQAEHTSWVADSERIKTRENPACFVSNVAWT